MKTCMFFVSLLLYTNTFTADQLTLSSYVSYDELPLQLQLSEISQSHEDLIKKMQTAARPSLWGGKDFEKLLIQVPGERRFYERVSLDYDIEGLLSGNNQQSVEVMARRLAYDSVKIAREKVQVVQEICKVALAVKKLERMCDILLPEELAQYVADLKPCAHRDDECNNYWRYVKEQLEQHADRSMAKHFGVIMVPYQQ